MAITITATLEFLNEALSRAETDATIQLSFHDALEQISEDLDCLEASATGTVSSGESTLAYPANYKRLRHSRDGPCLWAYVSTESEPLPLRKMEGTQLPALTAGDPAEFEEYGETFRFDRELSRDMSYRLDYYRYHPRQDTVLYPDRFLRAVCYLTTAFFAVLMDLDETAAKWLGLYQGEAGKLRESVKRPSRRVRYADL